MEWWQRTWDKLIGLLERWKSLVEIAKMETIYSIIKDFFNNLLEFQQKISSFQ
jgi:hypothetical protein